MKLPIRNALISIIALGLGLFAASSASAQVVYAATYAGSVIRYDVTDPNNIISNTSFISGLSLPHSLAISGSTLYVADYDNSTVGSYNLANGNAINASLISSSDGLGSTNALAISGSTLYVADYGNGTIGSFNLTTSTYNASFISGISNPYALAVSGATLYVANYDNGTVGSYNLSNGIAINASFITGLSGPTALAISGATLYVATDGGGNSGAGKVGSYDLANNGADIDASYMTALNSPSSLAIDGTVLYVGDYSGRVETHNLDSNTQREFSLVAAPDTIYALAVTSAVPEPSTYALFAGCLTLGLAAYRKRRRG